MPNRWEVAHHLNPHHANANGDPDHDGLNNIGEFRHGTRPHSRDTDDDGVEDGDEVHDGCTSTDPTDSDTDNDGAEDGQEDTDGDGTDDADDDAEDNCQGDDGPGRRWRRGRALRRVADARSAEQPPRSASPPGPPGGRAVVCSDGVGRELAGQVGVRPAPDDGAVAGVLERLRSRRAGGAGRAGRRARRATGPSNSTPGRGRSASSSASASGMPSPVLALTTTECGSRCFSRASTIGSAASALLTTMISGTLSAPISASTSRTAAIWPSGSACEPSTTWRTRSESATSSSVDRNASTSWWGRWRTKPTVSLIVYTRPSLVVVRRVVGSRVANSASSTSTPAR